jgi:hypothetical protein
MDDFLNEGSEHHGHIVTSPASYSRGSLSRVLNYAMTASFHIISSALFTTHPTTEMVYKVSY